MNINYISPTPLKKETVSATKTLFIFNPEHDLALAVGRGPYTPPAQVVKLRNEKSLLSATYADVGDFILIPDDVAKIVPSLQDYSKCIEKSITPVALSNLALISGKYNKIIPWGWDHHIRRVLLENGADSHLLPSEERIDKIRELSHRRISIDFRKKLAESLNEEFYLPPQELFSIEKVEEFLIKFPIAYLKAPWSSSGRGIIVSNHISKKGLLEWCNGILRRQGSIIAEPAWDRVFDFASEWVIKDNNAIFLGYSVFKTSQRGKYHENMVGNQVMIYEKIIENVPSFGPSIITAQKNLIEFFFGEHYEGYLGIDMFSDSENRINPCVEINLRLTMGHIPILRK